MSIDEITSNRVILVLPLSRIVHLANTYSIVYLSKIFQNRNLTLLWGGQIASQTGDSIYHIGLIWITLELTGSETVTGLVAMASDLPAILLSLAAGVAVDRYSRTRLMLGADAIRALVVLAIPLMMILGILTPTWLGLTAFALASAAAFFNPARDAFLPQIVPQDGLLKANSLIQTSWQMALLAGPAVAGAVLHYWGKLPLFYSAAAMYALSFLGILLIRGPSPLPPTAMAAGSRFGIGEIREGLLYVARERVIGPLLLLTVLNNLFIMGPAIVGTPVFIKKDLGLGADAYAIVEGCYAIGMILGTGLLLYLGKRWSKGTSLLVGMIFDGLTFIPILWIESLFALEVAIVIHAIGIPFLTVSRAAIIQKLVPPEMTGRVFALVNLAVVGMSAISSGLAGPALELIGARSLFAVIGIGGGLCGLFGIIALKRLRETN